MMSLPKLFFSILHTINGHVQLFCAQSPFSLFADHLGGGQRCWKDVAPCSV